MPSPEEQEAIVRAAVHEDMLAAWRQSEAGPDGFRLFEHEYAQPVDQEDKKILVTTVMRSLRNFFKSPTLREAFAVGRERWLTVEDLVSFQVGPTEVFLRMDLAYRDPAGPGGDRGLEDGPRGGPIQRESSSPATPFTRWRRAG